MKNTINFNLENIWKNTDKLDFSKATSLKLVAEKYLEKNAYDWEISNISMDEKFIYFMLKSKDFTFPVQIFIPRDLNRFTKKEIWELRMRTKKLL